MIALTVFLCICVMLVIWNLEGVAHARPKHMPDLTERGERHFRPEYDFIVYAAGCTITVFSCLLSTFLWRRRSGRNPVHNVDISSTPRLTFRAYKAGWKLRTLLDLIAIGSLAFYCFVPNFDDLSKYSESRDAFHHLDHYILAPALAYRHGQSLGTEAYTQYSVAWPLLLDAVSPAQNPLDPRVALRIAAVAMFVYFAGLYFFLRTWLRSPMWALAGTWLAFFLHVFCGGAVDVLTFPSSSIQRYSMDVACFAALLGHARSGRTLFAILAGLAAGSAVLFGSDTGIYLTVSVGCYAVAGLIAKPSRSLYVSIAWGISSWLVIILLGFTIASRGTVLSIQFWKGWSEPLWVYGAGLGALPIRDLHSSILGLSTLAFVLFVYLFVVCRSIVRLAQHTETFDGILRGTIAIYGLGTFIIFISRSAIPNLFHPIVPCCLLITAEACRYLRLVGRHHHLLLTYVASTAVIVSLGLLLAAQGFHPHPGLLTEAEKQNALTYRVDRLDDRDRWLSLTPQMKKWHSEGKTVALLGSMETGCLIPADVPPYLRYSPLCEHLVFWSLVDQVLADLRKKPPDVAVIPASGVGEPGYRDVIEVMRNELKENYRLVRTENNLDIYYRQ